MTIVRRNENMGMLHALRKQVKLAFLSVLSDSKACVMCFASLALAKFSGVSSFPLIVAGAFSDPICRIISRAP